MITAVATFNSLTATRMAIVAFTVNSSGTNYHCMDDDRLTKNLWDGRRNGIAVVWSVCNRK